MKRWSRKRNKQSNRTLRSHRPPRTVDEFFAMPNRFQDQWTRVTHVITSMRKEGKSLQQSSREFGLGPRTVRQWARPALKKGLNGRYTAKPTDKLLRVLAVPSPEGTREVGIRDSAS